MIINEAALRNIYSAFSTLFNKGLSTPPSYYRDIAMIVPSSTGETNYGWLGALPALREWVGDRVIHSLSLSSYTIQNKLFEVTVKVPRTKIEDDQYGIYAPIMEKMGADTARHPDEMVFGLLKQGFTSLCYDGQYFFDTDHPVGNGSEGAVVSVSNYQAGAGAPWFLLDGSQPIRPLIYQDRQRPEFQSLTDTNDWPVFMHDDYLYGVRARSNAGFGLWQLAYASKADLTPANYAAARAAMMSYKGDSGKVLGITPTHLVVPPSLEEAGLTLLNTENGAGGATNPWKATAKLIVSPWLA